MSPGKTWTQTAQSRDEHTNHEAMATPYTCTRSLKKIQFSWFSIEGGTRRLIVDYSGIYSRLPVLCLSRFSFLCFVLQVCLSRFRITLPFLAWLWSKQNWKTCLPFWTRSIKPFYLSAGLHGKTWEWVRMFQNGGQMSPRGAERTY